MKLNLSSRAGVLRKPKKTSSDPAANARCKRSNGRKRSTPVKRTPGAVRSIARRMSTQTPPMVSSARRKYFGGLSCAAVASSIP
jgi:hypothetical protein